MEYEISRDGALVVSTKQLKTPEARLIANLFGEAICDSYCLAIRNVKWARHIEESERWSESE